MGIAGESTEDNSLDIQIRIAEIDAEFTKMLSSVSANTVDAFDENKVQDLMREKTNLQQQLARIADTKQKKENAKSRLEEIYTIIDGLKNHPLTYDDQLVRKLIDCIVVLSKSKIKVVFIGGLEVEQELETKKTA